MTKKQKNALLRIIVVFVLMLALMIGEKTGILAFAEEFPAGLFIYLVPYGIIAWDILWKAARNIRRGQVFDENFLMTLATIGAFGVGEYSEAVAVMLFYQIGELFESYAVNRSRKSISDLMDICPEYANIEENGELRQVDPDDVAVDDIIVVKTGERIPLDGIVVEGESMVDTSALTGESVPRRVTAGSEIISGCVNGSGLLRIRVTKEFEDSTVAKILELVENASSKKAKVENFITRFAKYYTPVVVLSAVALAFLPPLILGDDFMKWIARACTFLVISCPCALVISVPLSFFGGIGAASRLGVLVKGSNFLEALSQMDTIVFDKTGTLTKGEFRVTELHIAWDGRSANITSENSVSGKMTEAGYAAGMTDARLLECAAYAESYSNHPIAVSIREAYESGSGKKLDASLVKDAEEISGHGVKVLFGDQTILAGNEKLMQQFGVKYEPCDSIGTVVYVAAGKSGENLVTGGAAGSENGDSRNSAAGGEQKNSQNTLRFCGSIVIADSIKEDAPEAIRTLKSSGIRRTVMLTGDRKAVGEAVAKKLGLDEVHTELLPADKVAKVEELLRREPDKKRLAFVGDGINDAPVLTRADIGIAMGSLGSDAAIEAADVVLMDDDTRKISKVVQIARKTMAIVKQNIVFALGVKFLVLILGAFGYANMWAAVFADVGVSVIAILNAMRTLRVK